MEFKCRRKASFSSPMFEPVPGIWPDPYVFGSPGSASGSFSQKYGSGSGYFHHHAKTVRKTLDFYCFVTSFLLFTFEEWCKCNSDPNPHPDPYVLGLPDQHPDPLVRGTDPRIWIRTKMSRIPNTGLNPTPRPSTKYVLKESLLKSWAALTEKYFEI